MQNKKPSILLIGLGNVGSSLAFDLLNLDFPCSLQLYDLNTSLMQAQFEDLSQSLPTKKTPHAISVISNLVDAKNNDIICISAGLSQKPGQTRLELISKNYSIIKQIIPGLIYNNPTSRIIILTNPVDAILQKLYSDPDLEPLQGFFDNIFSTGTLLDSHRLHHELGINVRNYDYSSVPVVLGEHGDSQVIFNSTRKRISQATKLAVSHAAYRIIKGKGCTNYAIAATTRYLIDVLLTNKNAILPLSSHFSYQSKNFSVALSLPIAIQNGVLQGIMHNFDTPALARMLADSINVVNDFTFRSKT